MDSIEKVLMREAAKGNVILRTDSTDHWPELRPLSGAVDMSVEEVLDALRAESPILDVFD